MSNEPVHYVRRFFLMGSGVSAAVLFLTPALANGQPSMTVWRDPSCGCCEGWIDHVRRNGFTATVIEAADIQPLKARLGVPPGLASCHTAEIAGYTIEGYVPARAIARLLSERPAGRGLAVPGMPMGSPGMEGAESERYDVMLFGDGNPRLFARFVGDRPL